MNDHIIEDCTDAIMSTLFTFNIKDYGDINAVIYYRAVSALQEAADALAGQSSLDQTIAVKTTAETLLDLLESWLARNGVTIDQVRFAASDAGDGGSVHHHQVADILATHHLLSDIVAVDDTASLVLVD